MDGITYWTGQRTARVGDTMLALAGQNEAGSESTLQKLIAAIEENSAAIAQLQPIKVTNATPVWAADNTYQDFGYRGTITVSGCAATMRPEVIFGNDEALSGDYAAVCESGTDCVYIYAKVNTAITIPVVLVYKA